MSLLRSVPAFRAVGIRAVHTSAPVAIQASKTARLGAIGAEETAGFKYTPDNAIIKGTVNDAVPYLPSSKSHGSYHWAFERLISAAIIPVSAAAAVASPTAHPIMDGILGATLVIHSHIGFTSCIDDYVHERKWGALGHAARWALRFGTAGALYGIYEFNTNDIGLTELIAKLWVA